MNNTYLLDYEKPEYESWNKSAGERRYENGVTLPWISVNLESIFDESMPPESGLGLVAIRDIARFRREVAIDPPEPWTPPKDDTGPIAVNDPRIRHLWVSAAEVAIERGLCESYDKIAKSVGVPTRQELKRTRELTPKMRLDYRVVLQFRLPTSNSEGYGEVHRRLTGAQIREDLTKLINGMNDDQLKTWIGHVSDYQTIS